MYQFHTLEIKIQNSQVAKLNFLEYIILKPYANACNDLNSIRNIYCKFLKSFCNYCATAIESHSFLDPYNIKKKVVKYTDDGIPFITVTNRAILYCQHGADKHVKTKAKYTESVRVRLSFVLQPSVELDESKIELCLPLLKQFNLTHPYTHQSSFKTWRKNFYRR